MLIVYVFPCPGKHVYKKYIKGRLRGLCLQQAEEQVSHAQHAGALVVAAAEGEEEVNLGGIDDVVNQFVAVHGSIPFRFLYLYYTTLEPQKQ